MTAYQPPGTPGAPPAYYPPQPQAAAPPAYAPAYPLPAGTFPGAAPQGYPPQPAPQYAPAPAGAYDLGQVNMTEGKNLLPLTPQPGQPPIERLLALVSFVFNPTPPPGKKGPRKPRYEIAATCVHSSIPTEVGQTYHIILRAAMSAHDLNDYGIKADSQLTRQIVGAVNRIDPVEPNAPWHDLCQQLQQRNLQTAPAVIRLVSNAGRRPEKHAETGMPTGQFWPTHAYLPAPQQA